MITELFMQLVQGEKKREVMPVHTSHEETRGGAESVPEYIKTRDKERATRQANREREQQDELMLFVRMINKKRERSK